MEDEFKPKKKMKLLYILEILKKTDKKHPINATEISEILANEYNLVVESKSIRSDINLLYEEDAYPIEKCDNHNLGWYWREQSFKEYQLKILADCVANAKFLTVEESHDLIQKIYGISSKESKRFIEKTLVMDHSVKLNDKRFTEKFGIIVRAILERKKITFKYEDIVEGNKRVARRGGKPYKVSPYYLTISGPEYFVIVNTDPYTNAGHYRVEMMADVEMTDEPAKKLSEVEVLKDIGRGGYTIADYTREHVHFSDGDVRTVVISGPNTSRQHVIRKFGNNLMFRDKPDDHFSVSIKVAGTAGLYQWLAKYGTNVKLESPKSYVDGYVEYLKETLAQYEN